MLLDVEKAVQKKFISNTGGMFRAEKCIVMGGQDDLVFVWLPDTLHPDTIYIVDMDCLIDNDRGV